MPPKLKREDEIDKRADEMFNSHPDLQGSEIAAGKASADNQAFDDIAKNYDQSADPAQENTNIARAKEQSGEWKTNVEGASSSRLQGRGARLKNLTKKAGPTGGIVGAILAGFFGVGVFLSPSLALVHLKEVFTEDLNDQLAAMDIRTTHVFKAKLKDLGKRNSVCTGLVKVRCGLRGMSDKQLRAFAKAGVDIDVGEKNNVTRKTAVYAMTFTRSDGTKLTIRNPSELNRHLGDRNIRNQLRRAYNPKFYGLWDATAGKVFSKFGTGKASRLNGNTDEERNRSITDNVSGEESNLNPADPPPVQDNDGDGDTTDEQRDADEQREKAEQRLNEISNSGSTKSVLSGALKGVGVVGTIDTGCTLYNTLRAVEAGAKIIRARQLVAYSMVYLNTADKIKAGTATPEEVEYLGDKLSKIDTDEMVLSDSTGSKVSGDKVDAEEIENPDFGKSAYDSQGARTAFYNDAPTLSARSAQFTVGGGLVGKLASVNDDLTQALGGSRENIKETCGIVQNPFVRVGSLTLGIIAGIASGGTSLAISASASVALSLAAPILTAYLRDMIAGEVVGPDTEGVDAGNAIFSGTGVLLGDMAMQRGMQPASLGILENYLTSATKIKNEYIAMETEDARSTPLDVMNQYSFAGMFARKLLPSYTSSSSISASISSGLPRILSTMSASLLPSAKAVGDFNPERFEKCEDDGYKELGIDADIFCNVRYVLTPTELAMDTDENYDWMTRNNHVNDDTGEPTSDEYKDFVKNCTATEGSRIAGWGSTIEENGDIGKNCIDGKSDLSTSTLQHFRVYTMDRSIEEGMDNGPQVSEGNDSELADGGEGSVTIASFNILHSGPDPHERKWRERMPRSLRTLKENGVQVAGLQEVRPSQNALLQDQRVNDAYDIWPKDTNGGEGFSPNPVIWDKSKFEMVEGSGELRKIHYENELKKHLVLVKLALLDDSGNRTDKSIYVASTHDPGPVRRGGSPAARAANARFYKEMYAEKANEDIPMFLTGDFNSNNDGYCVLTGPGSNIINAYDASRNPPLNDRCPSKNKVLIDHIYLTKDSSMSVSGFGRAEKEYNSDGSRAGGNNGADHPTVFATIKLPWADDGTNPGGRIDGDDYARECGRYLSAGDCTGECVGFVKFRLVKHGVIEAISLGNGGAVTSTLGRLGFRVNTTPAVNSVMSLQHNSVGHTAMVSKVNSDGSIVVEEYNWPGGHSYGTRTISRATLDGYRARGIINFAHTETRYR